MFGNDRQNIGTTFDENPSYKIIKYHESSFIQRSLVNQRFNQNCAKLTLWEYLILLEEIVKLDEKIKNSSNGN